MFKFFKRFGRWIGVLDETEQQSTPHPNSSLGTTSNYRDPSSSLAPSTGNYNSKGLSYSPGKITAISLGACFFMLMLIIIIIFKLRTSPKKNKRKITNQKNDNADLPESLYEEINDSMMDRRVQITNEENEDIGEYSTLSKIHISEPKAGDLEMHLMEDSHGYCHMVEKDKRTKIVESKANPSSDEGDDEQQSMYSVLKTDTTDQETGECSTLSEIHISEPNPEDVEMHLMKDSLDYCHMVVKK